MILPTIVVGKLCTLTVKKTTVFKMITFKTSPFVSERSRITIPPSARIVFVSDLFATDMVGGAELTSEALIETAPMQVFRIHSRDVDITLLEQGADRHWIFGNFSMLNFSLIPTIIANMSYTVIEYDYKYCKHRSPEKHTAIEGVSCDCHNQLVGKYVSAFYLGAKTLWWMSEAQQTRYTTMFPFLSDRDQMVLSSVFSSETLARLKELRSTAPEHRHGWARLESSSWVKGTDAAREWCERNGAEQVVLHDMPYDDVLKTLSGVEGLVYLPAGGDTCPRLVIEAKLLGCKLALNDNVQHRYEPWFDGTGPRADDVDEFEAIEDYLSNAPSVFWKTVLHAIEHRPSISGYTTTLNCIKQGYPYEQCIRSMLTFCSQVVVVDGGSTDGTWEALQAIEQEDPAKIIVVSVPRDWSHPRFAVFDGMQKAHARSLCTGDLCWQMDCDEVVHEEDAEKIRQLACDIPRGVDIISLPVIEYWGGPDKVRADVVPWKWRLSRNNPRITHGIPMQLRRIDTNGDVYAAPGTDGCDMIDRETGLPLPHVNFYTSDVDQARRAAVNGDAAALTAYEQWFNKAVAALPGVFHYSWYDLPRKIRLYRSYWTRHWKSLYDQDMPDTAENNYMFDAPWSEVTDAMIEVRAERMKDLLGGWIWHRKWDGKTRTPSIKCHRVQPLTMQKIQRNESGDSNTVVSATSLVDEVTK